MEELLMFCWFLQEGNRGKAEVRKRFVSTPYLGPRFWRFRESRCSQAHSANV